MYRPIQFVNFHLFLAVVLLLVFISFQAHGQERLCPDGKRSYFGVCPDDGNNSRPLPAPSPKPAPAQPKTGPVLGSTIKDCDLCPQMMVIPAGQFIMGSFPGEEKILNLPKSYSYLTQPQHRVQIQEFALGKYEVTQEEWLAIMENNPSKNKGRTLPVENVTWNDAQIFVKKLSLKTGKKYRLPSEAEWEYAARGGSATIYPWGNSESQMDAYAWFNAIASTTNPVGQKMPNQFGLHDMIGNVYEWTLDCFNENYSGAPTDGRAWTSGQCGERVIRGGSFSQSAQDLTSANRGLMSGWLRGDDFGLRVARTP